MYTIYKDYQVVGDGMSLEQIAQKLHTSRQCISQTKKASGFYKWHDYFIVDIHNHQARAYFNYQRLGWLLNNPAVSYIAGVEIGKAVERIKESFLD